MTPHDESNFSPRTLPHICEDCEYKGCDPCPIGADEELCAEACSSDRPDYDDSTPGRNWEYYKDECREVLEERMEQENNDVTQAIEEGIDKFIESHPYARELSRDVVTQIWLDGMQHGADVTAGIYRDEPEVKIAP